MVAHGGNLSQEDTHMQSHGPDSRLLISQVSDSLYENIWKRSETLYFFDSGFASIFAATFVVYYGISCFLHFGVPKIFPVRSVRGGKKQNDSDTWRDAVQSLIPVSIRAYMLYLVQILHKKGYGVLKDENLVEYLQSPFNIFHAVLMLFLLDVFHDTWFYFFHRLLHYPVFMKHVHYIHHQSKDPSAFSGYSFHWLEAVIMFVNAVVEIFIFPIPFQLHRIYELWMIAIHIGGHCGYEIFPYVPHVSQLLWAATGMSGQLRKLLNDVYHHDIHHQYPGFHFSLYFTHWDKLLGTIHPKWSKTVEH